MGLGPVRSVQFVQALFVGGLLVAGGLTFPPGRLMWRVVFG